MLNSLLRRLAGVPPPPERTLNGPLALSALLVRLARADGRYSADERHGIVEVLASRYRLDKNQASELRTKGELLEADAADTVRFTRALKEAVPLEDREEVLEALWSVVLADGKRDAGEDQMMRLCADLLGISDRDSNLARQRAAEKSA